MSKSEAYYQTYIELVNSLPLNSPWDMMFELVLSATPTQRRFQTATGLSWSTIKRNLKKLAEDNLISIRVGTGRGNKTTVSFLKSPSVVLSNYLLQNHSNLSSKRVTSIENQIKRLAELSKSFPNLIWWQNKKNDSESQLLAAPSDIISYADDIFIGRKNFTAGLVNLLSENKVVAIVGQPGTGKSHFIAWFQDQLLKQAKHGVSVYCSSLSEKNVLEEFANDFLGRVHGPQSQISSEMTSVTNKTSYSSTDAYALLTELRKKRYLIVLDNFEQILDSNGFPREEGYQAFLKLILEHDIVESRVLLVGRWLPKDQIGREPIAYELTGMDMADGESFLRSMNISLPKDQSEHVINQLGGNPLSMQLCRNRLLTEPHTIDLTTASQAVEQAFVHLTDIETLILGAVAVLGELATENLVQTLLKDSDKGSSITGTVNTLSSTKRLLLISTETSLKAKRLSLHPLVQAYVKQRVLDNETYLDLNKRALTYWLSRVDHTNPLQNEWGLAIRHALESVSYDIACDILFKYKVAQSLLTAGRLTQLKSFLELLIQDNGNILEDPPSLLKLRAEQRGIHNYLDEIYRMLGLANWRLGLLSKAESFYRRLIALDELFLSEKASPEYRAKIARDTAALAGLRLDQSSPEEGLNLAKTALQLAKDANDAFAEMEAWNWIGYAYDELGPVEEGINAYTNVISMSHKLEVWNAYCLGKARLGMLYWKDKQYEESRQHFEEALAIAYKVGDPYYLGLTQGNLGHYYMDKQNRTQSDLQKAVECYTKANEIHSKAGVIRGQGFWIGQLGRANFYNGAYKKALSYLKQASGIHRDVGDIAAIARHFSYIGKIGLSRPSDKSYILGIAYFKASIFLFRKVSSLVESGHVEEEYKKLIEGIVSDKRKLLEQIAQTHIDNILAYVEKKNDRLPLL